MYRNRIILLSIIVLGTIAVPNVMSQESMAEITDVKYQRQIAEDTIFSATTAIRNLSQRQPRRSSIPITSARQLGVDSVIVTGFCAEHCVLSTYRGAQDFDFTPITLKGSLASDNAEHIRFVEEITETISFGALRTLL